METIRELHLASYAGFCVDALLSEEEPLSSPQQNLVEEKVADQKLTQLAKSLIPRRPGAIE